MKHPFRHSLGALLLSLALLLRPHPTDARFRAQASAQPASGDHDGPAELPRVQVESSIRDTPAPGKVLRVQEGEDPARALAQAACGDTIELQAGATFSRLVLPQKKCDDSHWIIIRTSAPDAKLPAEGTRLTPCYAGVSSLPGRPPFPCASAENVLAKIEFDAQAGSGPVIIEPGANHYRLIGLEVTRVVSPALIYVLIGTRNGVADHLVFDRMWIHGTAQNETVHGLFLSQIRYAAVVDSYFSDFHCVARTGGCVDSQAILGGLGDAPEGPFKIENNFLEAAGECILFGGGKSSITPEDIEIRHNHLFKPLAWMKGQPGFVGGVDGNPFIAKNLFELKNAERLLFEGNILENSWGGFTQRGFGILLTPKSQAIGEKSLCPNCRVTDITIRMCRLSHVGSGFAIANAVSDNGGAAKDGGRFSIHDVIVDDVRAEFFDGFGIFAQIATTSGPSAVTPLHDVSIDHVTGFADGPVFMIGGPRDDPRMSRLSITNSIFLAGPKPVMTTGGGPLKNCGSMPDSKVPDIIFHDCFSSYRFERNVIVHGGGGWPKDNPTPKKIEDVGFSDYRNGNGGDYRLSPTSKFKHAPGDQKDVGADFDATEQAIRGVD